VRYRKDSKIKKKNGATFKKLIVYIIMFCSRNNLALKGHSENILDSKKGIFHDLIELISHYKPILKEQLKTLNEEKFKISYQLNK